MAKQKSIIKLEGTIGDISFYKSKDGYIAREKGGVSASRIASDPRFARTRENGAEFGRAGKAGKLLRTALKNVMFNSSDNTVTSRLAKEMVRVLKADLTSVRGQRNVLDGELELLTGFEFNSTGNVSSTVFTPFSTEIDRVSGKLSVTFPAFDPKTGLYAVPGATHFKLKAGAAEIDFENEVQKSASQWSVSLALDAPVTTPISLECELSENSTHPLFLAVGIEFFQFVNGHEYPLSNGSYNGLVLSAISGI